MRSSRERVPTSVQRRPQAPSEPSGAGAPARAVARRALLALQKPARKTKVDHCRPAGAPRIQVSRSRRPGRGGLGAIGAAAIRAPGRRRLRGSANARRKLHESCPLLLLRSPPRAGPRPLLPRRAGLRRGTHPRRAWPPGCAARAPGPPRAHTLPLGSNLQASMAGRPPRVAGRAQAAGGRCGGLGAQAAGAGLGGQLPGGSGAAAPREEVEPGAPRVPAVPPPLTPPGPGDPQQCGAARAPSPPRSLLSLSFSHSPRSSLSPALPVMSDQGEGLALTPSWLRRAARARPRPPPDRSHLPARGRGGSRAGAVGSGSGPLAREMLLWSPFGPGEGWRAGRPPLSLTKGGSDP